MEKNPKREILAQVKHLAYRLSFDGYAEINSLLHNLRHLLIDVTEELIFSDEECQLLVDTYNSLMLQRACYPSLLRLIKAGCICNDQIAVLENSSDLKMEHQMLVETLSRLENLSSEEILIFINGKRKIAEEGLLSEADIELLMRAKQLAKKTQ